MTDFLETTTPRPNGGHTALADLQAQGVVHACVTQNVDNLHQDAGSTNVIEYHGSLMTSVCRACKAAGGDVLPLLARKGPLPPRCACGGPLKPSAVLFGEAIPPGAAREASAAAERCDVMMVVGTSASVRPAADLPRIAARNGATVIEVNVEETGLTNRVTDLLLLGKAGVVLPRVADAVRTLKQQQSSGGGGGGSIGGAAGAFAPRASCVRAPTALDGARTSRGVRRRGGRGLPFSAGPALRSALHLM